MTTDIAACDLTQMKCIPCTIGTLPLKTDEIEEYKKKLTPDWEIIEERKLKRKFKFTSFMEAVTFVNKVAEIVEREGHHPDIHIYYNQVSIEIWTHKINGLSEADFVLASKLELLEIK